MMEEELLFEEYYENIHRQKPSLLQKVPLSIAFQDYYEARDIKGLTINQSLKKLYDKTLALSK